MSIYSPIAIPHPRSGSFSLLPPILARSGLSPPPPSTPSAQPLHPQHKIYVIGHKNPDTDSVVAATTYARLKSIITKTDYTPVRAGKLSPQTEYIYKRFNVEPPLFLSDLIPKVEYYMNTGPVMISDDSSMWEAALKLHEHITNPPFLCIVDSDRKYKGIFNHQMFLANAAYLLNPVHQSLIPTSLSLIERTLNATPITEFSPDERFYASILIGDDSDDSFKNILDEHETENVIVLTGDRPTIMRIAIEKKVKVLIVTMDYPLSKELFDLATANNVSILSSHDSTMTTASLIEYSTLLSSLNQITEITPVHVTDTIQKIRHSLSESPNRCLPVVDEDNVVVGTISESDLLREPNVQVILVDHNEQQQAIDGIENYVIQEIIDHHRINPLKTKYPITLINKPVGSTSSIIANMYREHRVPVPKDIAPLLLCGILSDTLVLQSATTTDYDRNTAEYLASLTGLDISKLGQEILESGSYIGSRTAVDVLHQDMKEFTEGKIKFVVSQFEVQDTSEVMKRKEEFIQALDAERTKTGNFVHALLVTDIRALSSLLFISCDNHLLPLLSMPKRGDHIYYLNDIVSRKLQFIPLMTELLNKLDL